VQRTSRGRLLTRRGFGHIGLQAPPDAASQLDLLVNEEPDAEGKADSAE
jgi:hypothetical protein